jgi:ribosomal protein S18 acetylase RimI-like enzyme
MAPPFTLRASHSSDARFFYDVTEKSMRAHVIAAGGVWEEEGRRKEVAEDILNPDASVIMIGEIDAGILCVERKPDEIRLQTLYLLPSYQARGVGSSIVSALQKEAVARCVPLRLHVLKVNPAKHFYDRVGFSVEEETEHFFYMRYG